MIAWSDRTRDSSACSDPSGMEGRRSPTGRALRESEVIVDVVVEQLPHLVFVKDADELRFVRLNGKAEEILGHSRAASLGKFDDDFSPVEHAASGLRTPPALGIRYGQGLHIARPTADPLPELCPRSARPLGAPA